MHFFDVVASVQVEVARPSEKTGGFFLFTNGCDQRFHRPQPTVSRSTVGVTGALAPPVV
ncbi:hypothetical protein [Streptomyces sp. NPDC046685]|uniref:hypothetical protein n=1 Tax=Streptomyces sp. NPDC046685 TaxID=3157202 RepID=UPI0033C296F5